VGNKCDVAHREVSREEGEAMASRYNLQYVESSAKTGVGIESTFNILSDIILQQRAKNAQQNAQHHAENNVKINHAKKNKKSKKHKKSKCSFL
jgi:50S ribosomal subunit-associated GTPase HflX